MKTIVVYDSNKGSSKDLTEETAAKLNCEIGAIKPRMKKILILSLLFLPLLLQGQIHETFGDLLYADTLKLDPLHNWISIDNPESNIWEVGQPGKNYFDQPLSGVTAMMTDSNDYYGTNLNDYFTITLPWYDHFWGEGILSFYHKYDTDDDTEGGLIEVSYNEGVSWMNVKDDTDHIETSFIGLPESTIGGGEFGFSGISDGWQYVELYWFWFALVKKSNADYSDFPMIRFRFISDGIETQKEGWMIDDIIFRGYEVSGNIDDYSRFNALVYPNPSSSVITLRIPPTSEDALYYVVYDSSGKKFKTKEISSDQEILHFEKQGLYLLSVYGDRLLYSEKIVIQEN